MVLIENIFVKGQPVQPDSQPGSIELAEVKVEVHMSKLRNGP